MKTLAIRDGDLVIGDSGHETVTGLPKITQDLRLALGEKYASDPFHPRWGSLLDRLIGTWLTPDQMFAVRQEVNRVISNYIAVQQAMIQTDILQADQSRFSTNDVIASVDAIDVTQAQQPDRLIVQVALTTLGRQTVTLTTAV